MWSQPVGNTAENCTGSVLPLEGRDWFMCPALPSLAREAPELLSVKFERGFLSETFRTWEGLCSVRGSLEAAALSPSPEKALSQLSLGYGSDCSMHSD